VKTKVLLYEELVEKAENAFKQGKTFNLDDGLKGKITEIKYFEFAEGIDSIVFKPIKNTAYLEEKFKLQDDFVVEVYDWTNLF